MNLTVKQRLDRLKECLDDISTRYKLLEKKQEQKLAEMLATVDTFFVCGADNEELMKAISFATGYLLIPNGTFDDLREWMENHGFGPFMNNSQRMIIGAAMISHEILGEE